MPSFKRLLVEKYIKEESERTSVEIKYKFLEHAGMPYEVLIFKSDEDRNLYRLTGSVRESEVIFFEVH